MAAKRLPTWAATVLAVAAATNDCPTPAANTYSIQPPTAAYPTRPLRELLTPVTAIVRWHDGDDAALAACLGTLRATLPRARVTVATQHVDRARRVAARFEVKSVVDADATALLVDGPVVVADASVVFQPDAARRRVVAMRGCAARATGDPKTCWADSTCRFVAVGEAQSVLRWLRGGDCAEPTAGLVHSTPDGCAHGNGFGEVVPTVNGPPYFALLHPSADCAWRAALAARLRTFAATCAAPPCVAPLSRVKNRKRTQQLLEQHGLNGKNGADEVRPSLPRRRQLGHTQATALRARRPLFAAPFRNATPTADCLLLGAGDYTDPRVYATFLRSLREAGSVCDVTLFTNDAADERIRAVFRKYGARWHRVLPVVPGLAEDKVAKRAFQTAPGLGRRASTLRFRIFRSYLLGESRHAHVGWVDVRDVFFQACPFSRLRGQGLHVFSETALLSLAHKRRVYLEWSRRAWGFDCPDGYGAYDDAPPINLGVVLGTKRAVLEALDTLICALERCGGWDQFLFSKLVYEGTIPATAHAGDDDAAVANLCANLGVDVGDASRVVSARGDAYAVVHQYDRYDGVAGAVAERWPFVSR